VEREISGLGTKIGLAAPSHLEADKSATKLWEENGQRKLEREKGRAHYEGKGRSGDQVLPGRRETAYFGRERKRNGIGIGTLCTFPTESILFQAFM
jgi:hypothetical protein